MAKHVLEPKRAFNKGALEHKINHLIFNLVNYGMTSTHFLCQSWFLFMCAKFKELLYDVIAEDVSHKAIRGSQYLWEH